MAYQLKPEKLTQKQETAMAAIREFHKTHKKVPLASQLWRAMGTRQSSAANMLMALETKFALSRDDVGNLIINT